MSHQDHTWADGIPCPTGDGSTTDAAFLAEFRAGQTLNRRFYAFAIAYGAQRFVWEFLKPYPSLIGPLNLFHLLSAGLVVYGVLYWRSDLDRERRGAGGLAA